MNNIRGLKLVVAFACALAMCVALGEAAAAPKPVVPAVKAAPNVDQLPEIAPEEAFAQLTKWDNGQPMRVLWTLERYIGKSSGDAAARLSIAEKLAAIISDAKVSDGARKFACQQMALVGGDAQVPALARLLADAKTADYARLALEVIPGDASGKALRDAMGQAKGITLAGIVNSLGERRDAASVDALSALIADADAVAASAAMKSLGKIGTIPAGEILAKAQAGEKLQADLRDAQFRCGENLIRAGNAQAAAGLYLQILKSNPSASLAAAALAGLVKADPAAATPLVMQAVAGKDESLCASALQMTRDMPGPAVTAALVAQLPTLSPAAQAVLLGVLADRGDRSSGGDVMKCLASPAPAVREAAAKAMGVLGDGGAVETLAQFSAGEKGETQQVARAALALLAGPSVDARLLDVARKAAPAVRAEALLVIAARRTAGASAVLLAAAADADEKVRLAAFDALAAVGEAEDLPKMIPLLVSAVGETQQAAERAIVAVGLKVDNPTQRTAPILEALKAALPAAKPAIIRVLGGLGGAEALKAVCAADADPDAALRDAAIRTLANWPDESAGAELLVLSQQAEKPAHKLLALQGYVRLARAAKEPAVRFKMLKDACPVARSADAKRMILGGLSDGQDAASLELALTFLADAEVREEAGVAVVKIGKALAAEDRAAVMQVIAKLKDAPGDKAVNERTAAQLREAIKLPAGKAGDSAALKHDQARSDGFKKELVARSEKNFKGFHLACYLDCGPDVTDGVKDGPTLNLLKGQGYHWPGADGTASVRFATVAFAGKEVTFQASGLNSKKTYVLGLSWWDYDHNDRVQSVVLSGKDGKDVRVVDKAPLPSHVSGGKMPEERSVVVPPGLYGDGSMKIAIHADGGTNAVICELWLWESDAEGAPAPALEAPKAAAAPSPAAEKAASEKAAVDKAGAEWLSACEGPYKLLCAKAEPGRTVRVLIVTGVDGHHRWQQTTPVLLEQLCKDRRLLVDVSADPMILTSDEIKPYDAIVLHFVNGLSASPGSKALDNLKAFVEGGKGLAVIHFACGAFQGNAEFQNLIGRGYDPRLRGHDPRGEFEVRANDVKHAITAGMQPFKTTDELYTCLAGEAKIEILAVATSKVDKKDYPMAFVLNYGKGRVFHCPLGHDTVALKADGPGELIRRGTAWAAGQSPTEK